MEYLATGVLLQFRTGGKVKQVEQNAVVTITRRPFAGRCPVDRQPNRERRFPVDRQSNGETLSGYCQAIIVFWKARIKIAQAEAGARCPERA